MGSPASSVLREAPTSCRPSRLARLPSLGGTSRAHSFVAPTAVERHSAAGLDALTGHPVRFMLETTGPPRFLADPHVNVPCSLTPARPRRLPFDSSALRCCLPPRKRRRPSRLVFISGLAHTARSLPVYASQPGSPPDHATLGSGRSLTFAGRARPAGSVRRFQLMPPPPPGFAWRTICRIQVAPPEAGTSGGRGPTETRPLRAPPHP